MINRTRRFLSSARWLSAINVTQAVLLLAVSIVLVMPVLAGICILAVPETHQRELEEISG